MAHYKGSVGTSLTIERKMEYHSDVFKDEKEYYRYAKLAGKIEQTLGLTYCGHTDKSLKKFVDRFRSKIQK